MYWQLSAALENELLPKLMVWNPLRFQLAVRRSPRGMRTRRHVASMVGVYARTLRTLLW